MEPHRGILISRIPVEGTAGMIVVLGMTAIILFAVPTLRPIVILCMLGGALTAPLLWRRSH